MYDSRLPPKPLGKKININSKTVREEIKSPLLINDKIICLKKQGDSNNRVCKDLPEFRFIYREQ